MFPKWVPDVPSLPVGLQHGQVERFVVGLRFRELGRGAVRKFSFLEVCDTIEIPPAYVRQRSIELTLLILNSSTFAFKGLDTPPLRSLAHPGASVTDMRHVVFWFALSSVRLRPVRSTTFVAKCLRRWQRVLFSGVCLHCWLQSEPRTQRISLPFSTLRSSSPLRLVGCPPVGGFVREVPLAFPRTAPTCLRGCGRRCVTLSRWTGSLWWPKTRLTISHRSVVARVQPPGDGPPPARALRPLELGQGGEPSAGLPDCAWVCQPQKKGQRAHRWQHRVREEAILQPALRPRLCRPPRRGSSKCPTIGSAQ